MLYFGVESRDFTTWLFRFFLCILLINVTNVLNNSLCQNGSVDCSSQFGDELPDNSCIIHDTPICSMMSISTTPPLQNLETEDNAPFEVSLTQFPTEEQSNALNISLDIKDPGITGFFLFFQQKSSNYNSCRVFDFSGVRAHLPDKKLLHFHYDCYRGFHARISHTYNTIYRALPINKEFEYKTYVPTQTEYEARNICDWKPVALMNVAVLPHRTVDLKFSTLDSVHNVESYSVILTSNKTSILKTVSSVLPPGKQMLRVLINDVPGGNNELAVVPQVNGLNCTPKTFFVLHVPPEKGNLTRPYLNVL